MRFLFCLRYIEFAVLVTSSSERWRDVLQVVAEISLFLVLTWRGGVLKYIYSVSGKMTDQLDNLYGMSFQRCWKSLHNMQVWKSDRKGFSLYSEIQGVTGSRPATNGYSRVAL